MSDTSTATPVTDLVVEPPAPTDDTSAQPEGSFTDKIRDALRAQMADAGTQSVGELFTSPDPDLDNPAVAAALEGLIPTPNGQEEGAGDGAASSHTTPAPSPPAPAPAPAAAPDAPDAFDAGSPGLGADGSQGEGDQGTAAPPSPDIYADLNTYAEQLYGTRFSSDQARDLFNLANIGQQLATLDPAQRAQIAAILNGQQPAQVPVNQPSPAPGATPGIPGAGVDEDEYARAIAARYIDPLAQSVDQMRATLEAQQAAQMNADLETKRAIVTRTETEWRTSDTHAPLTDDEWNILQQKVTQAGTFMGLVGAHGGDVAAAARAAYEQVYWSDPTFRAREHTAALAAAQVTQAADTQRITKAASVSGGGGQAVPRDVLVPDNPADRRAAFAQGIARAMASGDLS